MGHGLLTDALRGAAIARTPVLRLSALKATQSVPHVAGVALEADSVVPSISHSVCHLPVRYRLNVRTAMIWCL